MISSFNCQETEQLFNGNASNKFPMDIQRKAKIKLLALHAINYLKELASFPGNQYELLKRGQSNQYTIKIDDLWYIRFEWKSNSICNVEVLENN